MSNSSFVSGGGGGVVLRYFGGGASAWGWRAPRKGDPVFPSALHVGLACPLNIALAWASSIRASVPAGWRVILRQAKRFNAKEYSLEMKVVFPPRTPGAVARAGLAAAGVVLP